MNFHKKLKSAHFSAVIFLLTIFLVPILIFCIPKEKLLEDENKERADFPQINFHTILDKSFMNGFEDYAADAFPNRSGWIGLQTRALLAMGQREINGIYILKDRLIPRVLPVEPKILGNSIDAMKTFADRFPGTTYLMLIPTAAEIYRSELPPGAPTLQEKSVITEVYTHVRNHLTTVDTYSSLDVNRDNDIYYRNDHHWTSKGAHLGYSALGSQLGFTAVPADLFNVEHASHSFRGSSYSKVIYNGADADTIDLYSYPPGPAVTMVDVFDGTKWTSHSGLYCREHLKTKDKYSVFLGQNQPVITIRTDSPEQKKLLVFCDSYARSLAPFLALHYSEVTLVDLRYFRKSFESVVELSQYDQALFCYNMKNFTEEDVIKLVNLPK